MTDLVTSKRFLTAVVGVIAIAANHYLGLDEEQVIGVATIIVGWIIGDSLRRTGT
jgi:hypothetical protein